MANPITITIATVDRTLVIPFREHAGDTNSQLTIEEISPGTATAHLRIWDVTNSITLHDNDAVVITDASVPGHNMFNGYVSKWRLETYATYRIWDVDCVDVNSWLDLKIVGAPDGTKFLQDPPGTYTAIDPNAVSQKSDAATVQWLFSHYAADLPVDTTTFVGTFAPNLTSAAIRWSTVTLRQALDDIASLTSNSAALRFWIDPDWNFHWVIVASPLLGAGGPIVRMFPVGTALPTAPMQLTDGVADNITTINYEAFTLEYDDTQWADSIYVVGSTGYTYLPSIPATAVGGSGWVKNIGPVGRQRILTANNSDYVGARDSIGGQALATDSTSVVRGACTVDCNFGGWSTGQSIGLTNSIAGLSNVQYMIQKVTTTFLSGLGDRQVALEWGTAPAGTLGLRAQAQANVASRNRPRRAAVRLALTVSNSKPGAGGTIRVFAQAVDGSGTPWPVESGVITWTVTVYDISCNDVTGATNFTLSPQIGTLGAGGGQTPVHAPGQSYTDLTTDPTAQNVTYYVTASAVI